MLYCGVVHFMSYDFLGQGARDKKTLLVAVSSWCPKWRDRRFVAFTNNEAVRGNFLKTWSDNGSNNRPLAKVFEVAEACSCQVWLERVPSQSNPSGYLSRRKSECGED